MRGLVQRVLQASVSVATDDGTVVAGHIAAGRRPSYVRAARPEHAEPLIDELVAHLRSFGARVETGRFRTEMQVSLVNDGPVTIMIEVV